MMDRYLEVDDETKFQAVRKVLSDIRKIHDGVIVNLEDHPEDIKKAYRRSVATYDALMRRPLDTRHADFNTRMRIRSEVDRIMGWNQPKPEGFLAKVTSIVDRLKK